MTLEQAQLHGAMNPDTAVAIVGAANDEAVFDQIRHEWVAQGAGTPLDIDYDDEILFTSVVAAIAAATHGVPNAIAFIGDCRVFVTMQMLAGTAADVTARYIAEEYQDDQEFPGAETFERELRRTARAIARTWVLEDIAAVEPTLDEMHEAEYDAEAALVAEELGVENAYLIVARQRPFMAKAHLEGADPLAVGDFVAQQVLGGRD
ncbi:hypothetical protein [Agromyces humi]|uniref:hypothetical protein n=1 Tax=Agromyces humi TaxID=1766800 RepID=UPI00135A874B|nr:hypothetical protein [Agromyces humi]